MSLKKTARQLAALQKEKEELKLSERLPFPCHGALALPRVRVTSYNLELRARGKFIGDAASKSAFVERVDAWRSVARKHGEDPFGKRPTRDIGRKMMERLLREGSSEASGILQSALDDFSRALADVIVQFRRHGWRKVERIAIGGGFRRGRLGEMAIARAQSLLHERGHLVDLSPIRHHPDEAGVVGAAYLVPSWTLAAYDAVLGVDIGGGSIRCGLVELRHRRDGELRKVAVAESAQWSHRDDGASRTAVIDEIGRMLRAMVAAAKTRGLALAPVVGVGCPGRIEFDGRIDRGTQNLPGDWEGSKFHLANEITTRVGPIGGSPAAVILHNDAVVQGLSEWPRMRHTRHWGILTIGTGLGNASFETIKTD